MLKILSIKFKFIEPKCLEIIMDAQKENYVLVSRDGYIMTKGYYIAKTSDNFLDNVEMNNYKNKINFDFKPYAFDDQEMIECLTVVAGMMPVSEEYIQANTPWQFMFTTPAHLLKNKEYKQKFNSCLYQICYVPHKNIAAYCLMLKNFQEENLDNRKYIKRIAVVENPEDAFLIPYIGFTNIVKVKNDKFEIVEQRTNPWEQED